MKGIVIDQFENNFRLVLKVHNPRPNLQLSDMNVLFQQKASAKYQPINSKSLGGVCL